MPKSNRPRCAKVWQPGFDAPAQPTCYTPRNPFAPWLAAEPISEQAHADSEAARIWIHTPGPRIPAPYQAGATYGGD